VGEDLAGERGLAASGLAGDDDQLAVLDAAGGVEEGEDGCPNVGGQTRGGSRVVCADWFGVI